MQATSLWALAAATVALLVAAPYFGWIEVVRVPAVLLPALALFLLVTRPWRVPGRTIALRAWLPTRRQVIAATTGLFLALGWYVATRFESGEINAVDFTVYFDRPCYQTSQGRPLLVEVSDTPQLSWRSELGDHAYWAMLPLCMPYAIHPSPYWLHAASALSISLGAAGTLALLLAIGAPGVAAAAGALVFVLNDNTARALNYGFHPEILYAALVPWLLVAALKRRTVPFLLLTVACVSVKEDAVFPLLGVAVAIALTRGRELSWRERAIFIATPPLLALANLVVYYELVVPWLTGQRGPTYAHFWANWGDRPWAAATAMATNPLRLAMQVMDSGIFRVLGPFLFLPLAGWRWCAGMAPLVVLYAASANEQVKDFGIYYPIVLVPFLAVAAVEGARALARRLPLPPEHAAVAVSLVLLAGSISIGAWHRGYSLRPWKPELQRAAETLAPVASEAEVLIQSGLFPHVGYDSRFVLLTRETLVDPTYANAPRILSTRLGGYPFEKAEIAQLAEGTVTLAEGPFMILMPGSPDDEGEASARESHPSTGSGVTKKDDELDEIDGLGFTVAVVGVGTGAV